MLLSNMSMIVFQSLFYLFFEASAKVNNFFDLTKKI